MKMAANRSEDPTVSESLKTVRGIVTYRSRRSPVARLFCCSYAGGGSTAYSAWRDGLPDDIELCAFELPGRGGRFREAPLRSMSDVVDHIETLLGGRLDLPFALYGHSMGAVTALEVARRLVGNGRQPRCLVVSGCAAPHLPSRRERPLYQLPRTELLHELNRLEGLPSVMLQREDFLDTFLPTIRADMECRERWISRIDDLAIPIHALGGTHDKMVSYSDLSAWQHYTSSTFAVKQFAGGHFFINTAMHELVSYIAAVMNA
ncbi:MAG TPA: alpha/beta fold hydrolase [Stellaceae bacterium]|jgi:surfactin synthase thioesterase subunit